MIAISQISPINHFGPHIKWHFNGHMMRAHHSLMAIDFATNWLPTFSIRFVNTIAEFRGRFGAFSIFVHVS